MAEDSVEEVGGEVENFVECCKDGGLSLGMGEGDGGFMPGSWRKVRILAAGLVDEC